MKQTHDSRNLYLSGKCRQALESYPVILSLSQNPKIGVSLQEPHAAKKRMEV
jgi:hypothetical protein